MRLRSDSPSLQRLAPLFLAVILLALARASAEKCPTPNWLVDRIRPVNSTNGSISSHISENPSEVAVVTKLLRHFEELGYRREHGEPNRGIWLCEDRFKNVANTVGKIVKHLGLGHLGDCVVEMTDNGVTSGSKGHFDALMQFSLIAHKHSKSVLNSYGISWNGTFLNEVLRYEPPDVTRHCDLAKSLAFRINGRWAKVTMLTNESVEIAMPKFRRGFLQEAVSLGRDGLLTPVDYRMPVCENVPGKGKLKNLTYFETGNAYQSSWAGRPSWSHYGARDMGENPAIELAVGRGDHERELVEDSVTVSSLAILLLPACLALIPLGLFQDVSLSLTLMYTLATDVVSVLPVAIKGIELVVYADKEHYGTVSHLYGAGNLTNLAVAETWVARCRLRSSYRRLGIGLLSTAVGAMTLGIVLEFITRISVRRLRMQSEAGDDFFWKDHPQSVANGGLLAHMRSFRREESFRIPVENFRSPLSAGGSSNRTRTRGTIH